MPDGRRLIFTLGESPGVVTEALDKYFFDPKHRLEIQECLVVHTNSPSVLASVEKVRSAFEGGTAEGGRLRGALYPFKVPGLEGQPAGPLDLDFFDLGFPDLVTEEQHQVLMGRLAYWIAEGRQAGRQVEVCLAGGRKTESACAAVAAQFFGASRVTHVLPSGLTREDLSTKALHYPLDKYDLTTMPLLDLSPLTYRILVARDEKIGSPEDALRILREFTTHIPALAAREVERVYRPRDASQPFSFGAIETQHPEFAEALERAQAAATSDDHVLITGETGVGKEVLARAIHEMGSRKLHPFKHFQCGQYAESLFESELFGVERGAHSEAKQTRPGPLEDAGSGTIFIDEVDSLKPSMQAKLLRLVQSREFERVGGRQAMRVKARFVFATNQDLDALIRAKAFREDLRNRMRVISIEIPPLRERKGDIPGLAARLLERLRAEGRAKVPKLTEEAVDLLVQPAWPGNVRDLENALREWTTLGAAKSFPMAVLKKCVADRNRPSTATARDETDRSLQAILDGTQDYRSFRSRATLEERIALIHRARAYYAANIKGTIPLKKWTKETFKADLGTDMTRAKQELR